MNNLSIVFLGLVLTYIPACLSILPKNTCFSEFLIPSYPCCNGNRVVYTDSDGAWGVENGKWCGIDSFFAENFFFEANECFSVTHGYPCCKSCKVVYTDKDGKWGVESGKWCGIKSSCDAPIENEVIETPAQNATDVSDSNADFDFSFLKLENNKTNMLYSPLSILYALEMLQEGADGNTLAEISKVTGNAKLTKYTSIEKILSLANGLHIKNTVYDGINKSYINTVKEKYDADIIKDEFKDAQKVNKWIEDKTFGIIKDMVKDGVVKNPNIVMLIINALAIDMEWALQFKCDKTYGETFYLDNGKEMKATMMFNKEISSKNVAYYKDDDLTVLSMDLKDYNGTQFEFMAIMPKENLSGYVENVTKEQISEIDKQLKLSSDETYGVNVKIPKFKFNYDLGLSVDLMTLGINDAFSDSKANFSKMVDANNVYVSDALHKADIEFSEEGVKAAAVTVIIMMTKGMTLPLETHPVDIVINKPFMFIIRDKNTKDIWFTGTVYEPNSWENDKDEYTPSNGF